MRVSTIFSSITLLVLVSCSVTSVAADVQLKRVRTVGTLTHYTGTLTLDGTVERRTDENWQELMGDLICFSVDSKGKHLIPRNKDDTRDAWFCFDDNARALSMLKLPTTPRRGTCGYSVKATIKVSNYIVNVHESEVTDLTTLVSVLNRGALNDIKCE